MTVAIACAFQDGVLFCADTKLSTGYEKRNDSKILSRQWGAPVNNGVTVFTLAGSIPYAAAAIERCEDAIGKLNFGVTSLDEIQATIDVALNGFYQSHIFPHPDRSTSGVAFDLLIGLWLNGETRILSTQQTALSRVYSYECVGVGGYMARYWLRQAFGLEKDCNPQNLTLEEVGFIAECAMNSVVEYDEACGYDEPYGGDAEFLMMRSNGEIGDLRHTVHLGEFAKSLQSTSWGLLRRLAKSEDMVESERAVDDYCETVRGLHKTVLGFMESFKQIKELRDKMKAGGQEET